MNDTAGLVIILVGVALFYVALIWGWGKLTDLINDVMDRRAKRRYERKQAELAASEEPTVPIPVANPIEQVGPTDPVSEAQLNMIEVAFEQEDERWYARMERLSKETR